MLASPSKIALNYVEELQKRITRAQVDAVKVAIEDGLSSDFGVYVVGSYRRGSETCSDIDIILFHPSYVHVPVPGEKPVKLSSNSRDAESPTRQKTINLLKESVINPLKEQGIIAATLTGASQKWQGIVRIPNVRERGDTTRIESPRDRFIAVREQRGSFRRMDISLYPIRSKGAALLATTGDSEFNAHIRSIAIKLGLHLNEYGLWAWRRSRNGNGADAEPVAESATVPIAGVVTNVPLKGEKGYWELVASETEEEILEELGFEEPVVPEKRNFSYISNSKKSKIAPRKRDAATKQPDTSDTPVKRNRKKLEKEESAGKKAREGSSRAAPPDVSVYQTGETPDRTQAEGARIIKKAEDSVDAPAKRRGRPRKIVDDVPVEKRGSPRKVVDE